MLLFAAFVLGLALTGCSEARSIKPLPRQKRMVASEDPYECPPCAWYDCPDGYYETYEPPVTINFCSCPEFKECVQKNTKEQPIFFEQPVSLVRKKRTSWDEELDELAEDPCYIYPHRKCNAVYYYPDTCPEGFDLLTSYPMYETESGHLCPLVCDQPIYTCYNKETDEYCDSEPYDMGWH